MRASAPDRFMPVQAGRPSSLPDTVPVPVTAGGFQELANCLVAFGGRTRSARSPSAVGALHDAPMHSSSGTTYPVIPPPLPAAPLRQRFLSTDSAGERKSAFATGQ
jgi:hypothetical protein